MNRRTLFGKFAAVAAAAALAPAVQAEARAEPMKVVWETYDEGADLDAGRRELMAVAGGWEDALSDARAEGYRAGWETRRLSDESRAQFGGLTMSSAGEVTIVSVTSGGSGYRAPLRIVEDA